MAAKKKAVKKVAKKSVKKVANPVPVVDEIEELKNDLAKHYNMKAQMEVSYQQIAGRISLLEEMLAKKLKK